MSGRLLAIGDIHGCYHPLRELVEDELQLTRDDELVLIGDYIDRGPHSKSVLDYIIGLKAAGFSIVTLLGNHESMLLKAMQEDMYLVNWLFNGGRATLDSFNIRHPDQMAPLYLDFLQGLKSFHVVDPFIFVHAGFNNAIADPFTDEYQMLWTRQENHFHPLFEGKTIIHGHSVNPVSDLQNRLDTHSAILNIDTGCVYMQRSGCGCLSAVDLTHWAVFAVENR